MTSVEGRVSRGECRVFHALPNPYNYLIFIPYIILLPFGIAYTNRTQQRLRREETPPS